LKSSNVLMTTKRDDLTKNFEISAEIRTLDDDGVVFVVTVSRRTTKLVACTINILQLSNGSCPSDACTIHYPK
jgi:hypothetical protein